MPVGPLFAFEGRMFLSLEAALRHRVPSPMQGPVTGKVGYPVQVGKSRV